MRATHTFAGIAVSDFRSAYGWYVRLLGRSADMFPHELEAVWRLASDASIYVVQDPVRAGNGLVTLAVDDPRAHAERIRRGGIEVAEQTEEAEAAPPSWVTSDPDGNTIKFFQDPEASTA